MRGIGDGVFVWEGMTLAGGDEWAAKLGEEDLSIIKVEQEGEMWESSEYEVKS